MLSRFTRLVVQGSSRMIKSQVPVLQTVTRAMSSSAADNYQYETLSVTFPKEFVAQVEINRPKKLNAMSFQFYREILECFQKLSTDGDCRAVVLCGAGKMFTAGIDVMELSSQMNTDTEPGRRGFAIRTFLPPMQEAYSIMEKCPKPVIAAVHNGCIGGGVDMVTACDIRYCTTDAYFQIKEVDIGICADLGTLQRLPKIVGNDSLVRELAYTARKMMSEEALKCGLVSQVFPDKDALISGAVELGSVISSKSPVAVQGTKVNLVYARDHTVADGLDYVCTWNQSMLQSEDVIKAAMAAMQKQTAVFSKL